METIVRGHCLCGLISFEYTGIAGPANYCHCEDCRRHTGSAFNIGVRFDVSGFHLDGGIPCGYTTRSESGNDVTRYFCPRCGSPVYTSSPAHPEYVYVKAGLIDDQDIVKPTHHIWCASSAPWCQITDDLPRYQKGMGK